jgi:hypothetical protein
MVGYRDVVADLEQIRDEAWIEQRTAFQRAELLTVLGPPPHALDRYSAGTEEAVRANLDGELG